MLARFAADASAAVSRGCKQHGQQRDLQPPLQPDDAQEQHGGVDASMPSALEYEADPQQRRGDNSTAVTTQGHDPQTQVVVDEPKAPACISARVWQMISN
jgi:hypothetical protein